MNISNEGWAWFVCGRRLLVWQASGKRPINTQCRELTLPPSDLAHRAHLVTVYTMQSSQVSIYITFIDNIIVIVIA